MNELKVLHLSTSMYGGAGSAATRLHLALVDSKVDSWIVFRERSNVLQSLHFDYKIFDQLLGKALTMISKYITKKPYSMVTPYSRNMISKARIKKIAPDVIHIHNWFNLLNEEMIAWLIKNYSVVFTLHDSRIYTGGCHYSFDCRGFCQSCKNCPATKIGLGITTRSTVRMKRALNANVDYHVISPSIWLLREIQEAKLLPQGIPISVVRNVIDWDASELDTLEEEPAKNKFLFIAADLSNSNKGLGLLLRSLAQSIFNSNDFQLVIVGRVSKKIIPPSDLRIRLEFTGELDREKLDTHIKNATLLIVPSIADNLPSVIAEAQFAGTPVLATNVGGIPDLISDGNTGFLCSPNQTSIRDALVRFKNCSNIVQIRMNAKNAAIERHSPKKIVSEHLHIYRTLHAKN